MFAKEGPLDYLLAMLLLVGGYYGLFVAIRRSFSEDKEQPPQKRTMNIMSRLATGMRYDKEGNLVHRSELKDEDDGKPRR